MNSQVYFKNSYSEPVYVAIGYYKSTREYKGWVTAGWYKVIPGERRKVLSETPPGDCVYYYAESTVSSKRFEGKTSLLVHPKESFTIINANKQYVQDERPSYKWYSFKKAYIFNDIVTIEIYNF